MSGDGFSGALSRVAGENVGPHAITQGTLALSANYALSFTGANLDIYALHITGAFTAGNKIYDGTTVATVLMYSTVGDIGGIALSGGTAGFADKNVGDERQRHLASAGFLFSWLTACKI